jgi:hypothetical protein
MRFGIRYWLKFGNSLGNLETVWVLMRLKAQLLGNSLVYNMYNEIWNHRFWLKFGNSLGSDEIESTASG